jgi:GGDEF domain-containing protein
MLTERQNVVALDCGHESAIAANRKRFQDKVAAFNERSAPTFCLSVSIGATLYDPARPRSLSELLADADKEMYERKRLRHGHVSSALAAVAAAPSDFDD